MNKKCVITFDEPISLEENKEVLSLFPNATIKVKKKKNELKWIAKQVRSRFVTTESFFRNDTQKDKCEECGTGLRIYEYLGLMNGVDRKGKFVSNKMLCPDCCEKYKKQGGRDMDKVKEEYDREKKEILESDLIKRNCSEKEIESLQDEVLKNLKELVDILEKKEEKLRELESLPKIKVEGSKIFLIKDLYQRIIYEDVDEAEDRVKIINFSEWEQDYKRQNAEIVISFENKYYKLNAFRSGNYYGGWYYNFEDCKDMSYFEGIEVKKSVKTIETFE